MHLNRINIQTKDLLDSFALLIIEKYKDTLSVVQDSKILENDFLIGTDDLLQYKNPKIVLVKNTNNKISDTVTHLFYPDANEQTFLTLCDWCVTQYFTNLNIIPEHSTIVVLD